MDCLDDDDLRELSTHLRSEVGYECRTTLREGVVKTRDWYRAQGWL